MQIRGQIHNAGNDFKNVEIFYLKEKAETVKGGKCMVCVESSYGLGKKQAGQEHCCSKRVATVDSQGRCSI